MNTNTISAISASLLAIVFFPFSAITAHSDQNTSLPPAATSSADHAAVHKLIGGWPPRPQLAAQQMLAKYGVPQESSSERLIWHNQGQYKRIMVTKLEIPHDFPKPHMDYLQHTIDYRVPSEKANSLIAYDGSVTIDRTAGEMSARCDLEGHNILTLNLAHDIITGKKDVEQARRAFGQIVVDDILGKYPPYTTALQFEPMKTPYLDPDKPVIPGSPKRAPKIDADAKGSKDGSDSDILAFVIASDDTQILAAMAAAGKKLSPQIQEYATMLHKEHGKNLVETMTLGQKMNVTPIDTIAVDKLRVKGAGELAALVPLDDNQFGSAYMAAMIKGHTEVLDMIDNRLLKSANDDALKRHLIQTRHHVAMHLEKAIKVQANLKR